VSHKHRAVSKSEWLAARRELLAREKALTHERDSLAAARRELPWLRVEKSYAFEGPAGKESLSDLFAGRSQLLVYHFMYPLDWAEACKSCSFWADGYDGIGVHLAARDVTLVAISISPYARLEAFRRRMGWHFKWVSSAGNDFNRDFGVTFTPEEVASKAPLYNFGTMAHPVTEAPGVSVFAKDERGDVYLTYQCFSRGLDALNPAYQMLDLVPKGRDEDALRYTMEWLRHHDAYGK
jgi:predicted dithiol-disulfide oxidoreductase (DUF899 family)